MGKRKREDSSESEDVEWVETDDIYSKDKKIEDIYQKKSQLEHILLRPDTYIGSVEYNEEERWVFDRETKQMVYRKVEFVPGLYKIFDEILVNAADNKIRSPEMDKIQVDIDPDEGVISVMNNGKGIPVVIHKEHNIYVPTLIFGHLLTGSHFNDDEKKITGGRNGYGAKLANIFSVEFTVETVDSTQKKKFVQTWRNNMSIAEEPKITSAGRAKDYTKVTFKPDLKKFKMTALDDGILSLMYKRVYDVAGTTDKTVTVYLNGEKLKIKTFKDYVKMYALDKKVVYEDVNDRWSVGMCVSDGTAQQVSFVNSIATTKGGKHVDYITKQIASYILEHIKKKNKSFPLKPSHIKNHMFVFVRSLIVNPSFDSQTKETLTTLVTKFGSKCKLSEKFLKEVLKCGIVDTVLNYAKYKEGDALRSKSGKKKQRITGISKLSDANDAGTKESSKCTLILTEGDSAKALAISGLSVIGRDKFGVFPLKGKPLNVRDATFTKISKNAEIDALTKIIGLKHEKQYTKEDLKELRYGSIMIMADQDHDGSHIKGLIINFIHKFWPSLLQIPNFLQQFITPIVKVKHKRRNETIQFFSIPEYQRWKQANNNGKGWTIKYYKGLGTSTADEAREYFSNLRQHKLAFKWDSGSEAKINLAFSKGSVEARKQWLNTYKEGDHVDYDKGYVTITDFFDKEMVQFSIYDNARSIPNVIDGFKPSQRKVLFSCFKRKLNKEIKVSQLVGYVALHSAYHHGEQSLCGTIVNMAQDFVGSNNINLLMPNGMFGTRLEGGADAASSRYICTCLNEITRYIFKEEDDDLLDYLDEDGLSIEPRYYVPILPMILVNGTEGIGTGWSTHVPNYNPVDIVNNLKRMINGEEPEDMVPWYRGFTGNITFHKTGTWISEGVVEKINDNVIEIKELPIKKWTQSYKEFLEKMLSDGKGNGDIEDFKEYHTDTKVSFVIFMTSDQMKKAEKEGFLKKFKLTSYIHFSNMTLFSPDGKLKKYETPTEILKEFYPVRLKFYELRKANLLKKLRKEFDILDNRVRFILSVINGEIVVNKRKKKDLLKQLQEMGFTPYPKEKRKKRNEIDDDEPDEEEEESDEDVSSTAYNYLLSMPLWSLTYEKVEELRQKREEKGKEIEELEKLKVTDLWLKDLDEFLEKLKSTYDKLEKLEQKKNKKFKTKPKQIKVPTRILNKKSKIQDEEEEKPKKRGRPKKKSDDDEEEKPKKTTKKKTTGRRGRPKKVKEEKEWDDDDETSEEDLDEIIKKEEKMDMDDESEEESLFSRIAKKTGVDASGISDMKSTKKGRQTTLKSLIKTKIVDISDSEEEKSSTPIKKEPIETQTTQVRSRPSKPQKKRRKLAQTSKITDFFSTPKKEESRVTRSRVKKEKEETEEEKEESEKEETEKEDSEIEPLELSDEEDVYSPDDDDEYDPDE